MVKYGKYLRKHLIEEWCSHYLDYKMLKKKINSIKSEVEKSFRESEVVLDSSSIHRGSVDSGFNFPISKSADKAPKLKLKEEFLSTLTKEIKRIYRSYIGKERELYININSHLHIRTNYDQFSYYNIHSELEELINISTLTLKISNFVNLNIIAIKKILKKFDKKTKYVFGKSSYDYISKEIESNNSDLLYLLQFKIIDETSAILDDLMNDLYKKYKDINNNMNDNITPNTNSNSDFNKMDNKLILNPANTTMSMCSSMREGLLNSNNSNNNSEDNIQNYNNPNATNNNTNNPKKSQSNILHNKHVKQLINDLFKVLDHNIRKCELESQAYRFGLKNWNIFLKNKSKVYTTSQLRRDSMNYIIMNEEDNSLKKRNIFNMENRNKRSSEKTDTDITVDLITEEVDVDSTNTSNNSKEGNNSDSVSNISNSFLSKSSNQIQNSLSKSNKINLVLIFIYTLLYMICYYFPYSDSFLLLQALKREGNFYGLVLATTSCGAFFSSLITDCIFSTERFKIPFAVSSFLLIISVLLYSLTNTVDSIWTMISSRFILGFASYSLMNRKYLLDFTPERMVAKSLSVYQVFNLLGISLAYFGNIFINLYTHQSAVNSPYVFSAKLSVVLTVIFFIILVVLYTEPNKPNFTILKLSEDAKNKSIGGNVWLGYVVSNNTGTNNPNNRSNNSFDDKKSIHSSLSISREALTKQERTMVDDLDDKLSIINDQNNFSDSNLVQVTLKRIILKECNSYRYLFRSMFFLLSLMFFTKYTTENLLITVSLISVNFLGMKDLVYVNILVFVSTLLVIPLSLIIKNKLAKTLKEEVWGFVLLVVITILLILIVILGHNKYVFWACFVLVYNANHILESMVSSLIGKLIPNEYNFLCFTKKNEISIIACFSRVIAGINSLYCLVRR